MDKESDNIDLICLTYEPEISSNEATNGERLDQFLARSLDQFSRSQLQKLIAERSIAVDGIAAKASYKLRPGQKISITIPPLLKSHVEPQAIPLDIVYQDEHLAVVNKPSGMVVHPGAGIYSGTLVHALLHHMAGSLSGIGGVLRPGIVHRLDKDTSGLLLIAKSDFAHQHLAKQIQNKKAKRIYLAVLEGDLPNPQGIVDAPIGRHPSKRTEMAILKDGREAQTLYSVLSTVEYKDIGSRINKKTVFSFVKLELKTGRTHQIRVHMNSLNCPVVGDIVYNHKLTGSSVARQKFGINGHFLHAAQISFNHPISEEWLEFIVPVPADWSQGMLKLFPSINCNSLQL